jgi:hypothetical protein
LLAFAIGLVAASPAAAGSDPGAAVYPGLVNSRMVRTQKALDRAIDFAEEGQTEKAVASLYTARLQVKLAWRAAKYVIENAPAPPAGDRVQRRARRRAKRASRLRASQSAAVADQYTTAGGVLTLQHTVAQTAIGMIDSAHGTLRDSLSRTIFTALDQRDAAVAYIHSIDVPPPPGDGKARASGAPVGGAWGTVMPDAGTDIDDEINQIRGAMALSATLGTGVRHVLKDAELQDLETQSAINKYWPPVVGD